MNLRELSEQLGLSQTTVSRALNGYPEVSEATRQRVLAAAQAHHYSPNRRATSLATGRAMSIGHVIPTSSSHQMVNVVFADFIAGAGEVYAERGYTLTLSMVGDSNELSNYTDLAHNGTVDAVLVHGPLLNDPRINHLQELGLPFLVHGRSSEVSTPYPYLDVNNKHAFQRATEFLAKLGHRRIALVNGQENMDFAARRRVGYLAGLQAHGIDMDHSLMFANEMTEPFGHAVTGQMLDGDAPPTAIMASSIVSAMGVRRAVEERGLVMGQDVSIVCFDDQISYFPNGDKEPIFTAARSSVRLAGRRCAELLIAAIENPGQPPVHEMWEADLVLGQSTGPAPN